MPAAIFLGGAIGLLAAVLFCGWPAVRRWARAFGKTPAQIGIDDATGAA